MEDPISKKSEAWMFVAITVCLLVLVGLIVFAYEYGAGVLFGG